MCFFISQLKCQSFRKSFSQLGFSIRSLVIRVSRPKFYIFYMFFPFKPPEAGMFQKQRKDHFILDVTQAEEILKSGSTDLHKQSKNMVHVENHQFLKKNHNFYQLSEMKIVSMFYTSWLFQQFLQVVSTIFCFGDI